MALFRNSPPALGQVGVNHAYGVTGLESLVRLTRIRLRAMEPISLNLPENYSFLDRKLINALNDTVDRH